MDAFTTHTGIGVPLRRSNVDTDQIIPAVYLKRVTRTGFEDGLFAAWRKDPQFVINQPQYDGATVLVAGPDFGTTIEKVQENLSLEVMQELNARVDIDKEKPEQAAQEYLQQFGYVE